MSECEKYLDLISAELDGELAEAEQTALYAHLEQCESCRRYRDALRAVTGVLEEDLIRPPVTLSRSVMARVSALPTHGGKKPEKKPGHLWRSIRSASLTAVALLAIWSGVRVFSPKGDASAAPAAAPAAMDMAAAESVESFAEPRMAAGMSRTTEGAEEKWADTAPAEDSLPAEAPMAMMANAEEADEPEKGSAATRVEIYRSGESLRILEDEAFWEFIQTQLLAAGEPVEIPEGEADYVLTLFYADGRVEDLALWFTEDGICRHRDAEETAFLVHMSPEEFLLRLGVS